MKILMMCIPIIKACIFIVVINSGLTKFSTYVYGVTATIAVVNMLWPGLIPDAEPAYVEEMRRYFEELKAEFRVVKNQINDLHLYVQERSTTEIYAGYVLSINSRVSFPNFHLLILVECIMCLTCGSAYDEFSSTVYKRK